MADITVTYSLEVQVPDPSVAGFRLDVTPLNSPARLSGLPGEFRLGLSTLAPGTDDGRLTPVDAPLIWLDLMPYATNIRADQGNRAEPGFALEPGSLSVTLRDAPDLDIFGVWPGAPIRLVRHQSHPLWEDTYTTWVWFGWLDDVHDTWAPRDHSKTTSLRAIDLAARLGNITRHGARSGSSETYIARVRRLLASAPEFYPAHLDPDGYMVPTGEMSGGFPVMAPGGELEPTVFESSLLRYLSMTAHSAGLVPWLEFDRQAMPELPDVPNYRLSYDDLRVVANERYTGAPEAMLTLTDDMDISAWYEVLVSYYDITVSTPAVVASVLEVTNHLTDGANAQDETTTVVNPTALTRYGRRSASLDLTAPPAQVDYIGGLILAPFDDASVRPHTVTIDAADLVRSPDPSGDPRGADNYLLSPREVAVHRLGRRWLARVLAIQDTLTPDLDAPNGVRHRMTLTLGYYT